MYFQLIGLTVFRIILLSGTFVWILYKIRQLHYRNFYYILAATFLYLVLDLGYFVQLLILLYFPRLEYHSAIFEIINIFWTVGLMVLIYTVLFYFMQNLAPTALPRWINKAIFNTITFIFATLFLSTFYAVLIRNKDPTYEIYSLNYPDDRLIRAVSYTLGITALIGAFFVFVLISAIIYYLSKNRHPIQSPAITKKIIRVRLSTMVIILGGAFSFFTRNDIWYTISLCGYIGVLFYYLRGDVLLWADRRLKLFLLIDTVSEHTVYDYKFNISNVDAISALPGSFVSSAITSFNKLLNEIIYSSQELQQITLEQTTILLKEIISGISALLIVDRPSPSLIALFDAFLHAITERFPDFSHYMLLSSEDRKLLDALIQEYFLLTEL